MRLILLATLLISPFMSSSLRANVVSDLLGNALVCALAERELAAMPIEPLYQVSDGQCEAVIPDADSGAWFTDAQCTIPTTYTRTSMQDYCAIATDRDLLGNGVAILNDAWTLTPGNRLDLGARSLESVSQPYMQRLIYRQIQTDRGRCDLEMRVYKKHPSSTEQRSMIALHGGSWTSRSFGYLGLELAIPHFVDQGFVVYAPFYRLLDNTDSIAACNQADLSQIIEDGNAALDWVLDNASNYGSSGSPVVFGQSAGAHLALSLSVNRPSSVSGAVLMYPPTDFADFLQRVDAGSYTNSQGLSVMGRVIGSDDTSSLISSLANSLSLPVVVDNSFPTRIAEQGADWPAMFIVHGSADELVEARHSVRLCDALAGRTLAGVDQEIGLASELREVIACGDNSEPASTLHLVQEADHALDVCIQEDIPDLCFSGGAASRALISQSLGEAVSFSVAAHSAVTATDENTSGSGGADLTDAEGAVSTGGGSVGFLSLLVLLISRLLFLRSRRVPKICQFA